MRPGFVMLRLLAKSITRVFDPSIQDEYTKLIVKRNNGYYLRNTSWRNLFIEHWSTIHGPCTSGILGSAEVDHAFCIRSDIWPEAALGCVRKLQRVGWPEHNVLSKILKQGCLFVPIGSKRSPYEDLEWRLSFSLAEKELMHSMTHNQFVTYGLLKIFLKEAIDVNQAVKGFLCSYFMKTILLWKIVQQEERWTEENFLRNFWKCFQLLITCVMSGYCPNFFIPENNMFAGKIEGTAQRKLLAHLTSLYRKGYRCLLECSSMQCDLLLTFRQPLRSLQILTRCQMSLAKSLKDVELILEIWNRRIILVNDQQVNLAYLYHADSLLSKTTSEQVKFVVKTWMKMYLIELRVMLSKQCRRGNKMHYMTEQSIMKVMRISSCDTVRHLAFAAIALYRIGSCASAINILQEAKKRLQNPHLMYPSHFEEVRYFEAGGDNTPLKDMMKTLIAFPVDLRLNTCIPGLELEHKAARAHSFDRILIPSLVAVNFLLFLCHKNEQNVAQSKAVLDELSTLVHHDSGRHIHHVSRAISWQLLGICQVMNGDYQGAHCSFKTAMEQRWCDIRHASKVRIRRVRTYLKNA